MQTSKKNLLLCIFCSLVLILSVYLFPPIPQYQDYHQFADNRTFLGIPNFMEVVTNLPFLILAILGLSFLSCKENREKIFKNQLEQIPYWLLFVSIGLIAFGSGYYHFYPNDSTLVWDRLPMTFFFMAYFSTFIIERIHVKAGLVLLTPLIGFGIFSVLYWSMTQNNGNGDLRPYIIVQYCTMLIILLISFLFPSQYNEKWSGLQVIAIYGISKAFEMTDGLVLQLSGVVSGHSVKHLLAAFAVYRIYHILRGR